MVAKPVLRYLSSQAAVEPILAVVTVALILVAVLIQVEAMAARTLVTVVLILAKAALTRVEAMVEPTLAAAVVLILVVAMVELTPGLLMVMSPLFHQVLSIFLLLYLAVVKKLKLRFWI